MGNLVRTALASFVVAFVLALAIEPHASGTTITFGPPYSAALPSPTAIAMSVHGGTVLGTIHKNVLGVNNPNASNSAANLTTLGNLAASTLGITGGRYPGGQFANLWDWQNVSYGPAVMTKYCNYTTEPSYVDGDFDAFMQNNIAANSMSAELQVDYETNGWTAAQGSQCTAPGDPTLAAAWVTYSNITPNTYGVKWWEVGNEEYIGANDQHTVANGYPNGPANPITFSTAEPAFYTAMKAVDSTIKVGISICGNTTCYSGWDPIVLANASYDYVIYHYYPIRYPHSSDALLLSAPVNGTTYGSSQGSITSIISQIRSELVTAGKCTGACVSYPISISEWSSVPGDAGPQTMSIQHGLFAAEVLGEFFNNSLTRAEFWASNGCEHDGLTGQPTPIYSWQNQVGTEGMVTNAMPDVARCPGVPAYAFGTVLPTARAFQLYSQSGFATEGASAVSVDEPNASVRAYAAVNGTTNTVMLINLNESQPRTVLLSIDGKTSGSSWSSISYTRAIYDQSAGHGPYNGPTTSSGGAWSTPFSITLPPWSMTTYTFSP